MGYGTELPVLLSSQQSGRPTQVCCPAPPSRMHRSRRKRWCTCRAIGRAFQRCLREYRERTFVLQACQNCQPTVWMSCQQASLREGAPPGQGDALHKKRSRRHRCIARASSAETVECVTFLLRFRIRILFGRCQDRTMLQYSVAPYQASEPRRLSLHTADHELAGHLAGSPRYSILLPAASRIPLGSA
ncbi:MAG: hypothetical protein QOF51_2117 [Chloroflexota bacterium]|nr:hypothetical protein [Chloroflexota bacterium]